MNEKNLLLIVASGKSSRFGGFPKAFCKIGEKTNADNTISVSKEYFDKVYIGVNNDTYQKFKGKIDNCVLFSIKTGQGDAHSLLKCLTFIQEHEEDVNKIAVCWGDAVFVDSLPFKQLLEGSDGVKAAVACAEDTKPYAWFETNEKREVVKTHFAKEEGETKCGLHDQSLFIFDFEFALKYLNEYRETLGISNDNDEDNCDKNEMKLLYSFEYLYESNYENVKCVEITPNKVLAFNTQQELENILTIIK